MYSRHDLQLCTAPSKLSRARFSVSRILVAAVFFPGISSALLPQTSAGTEVVNRRSELVQFAQVSTEEGATDSIERAIDTNEQNLTNENTLSQQEKDAFQALTNAIDTFRPSSTIPTIGALVGEWFAKEKGPVTTSIFVRLVAEQTNCKAVESAWSSLTRSGRLPTDSDLTVLHDVLINHPRTCNANGAVTILLRANHYRRLEDSLIDALWIAYLKTYDEPEVPAPFAQALVSTLFFHMTVDEILAYVDDSDRPSEVLGVAIDSLVSPWWKHPELSSRDRRHAIASALLSHSNPVVRARVYHGLNYWYLAAGRLNDWTLVLSTFRDEPSHEVQDEILLLMLRVISRLRSESFNVLTVASEYAHSNDALVRLRAAQVLGMYSRQIKMVPADLCTLSKDKDLLVSFSAKKYVFDALLAAGYEQRDEWGNYECDQETK